MLTLLVDAFRNLGFIYISNKFQSRKLKIEIHRTGRFKKLVVIHAGEMEMIGVFHLRIE